MSRRRKPDRFKQVLWAVITAICVSVGLGFYKNFSSAMEMGKKQETYEDAIQKIGQLTETWDKTNQMTEQRMEYWEEDQQHQWDAIYGYEDERPKFREDKRRSYYQRRK